VHIHNLVTLCLYSGVVAVVRFTDSMLHDVLLRFLPDERVCFALRAGFVLSFELSCSVIVFFSLVASEWKIIFVTFLGFIQ
jgi:hypothetical protein